MKVEKIDEVFAEYFEDYRKRKNKNHLEFVKTSGDRKGDPLSNPHALPGHAMDFTLRFYGDYAPISDYNSLFSDMIENWPYRAGIDNTTGNIHIHIDLGKNRPKGQKLPFFFKEDDGKYEYEITISDQL